MYIYIYCHHVVVISLYANFHDGMNVEKKKINHREKHFSSGLLCVVFHFNECVFYRFDFLLVCLSYVCI